jgi:hypothetical protein
MKRVAAAVGDGSSVIRSAHQYLSERADRDATGDPTGDPSEGQPAPVPGG